jgi:hypothetical protein
MALAAQASHVAALRLSALSFPTNRPTATNAAVNRKPWNVRNHVIR